MRTNHDRAARDRTIVARYAAGATQVAIAEDFGMSPSGVSRVLARLGQRVTAEEIHRRRDAGLFRKLSGRPPVWPDCPPHLLRTYRKVRAVIGSHAAREQLTAICALRDDDLSLSTQTGG